MRFRKRPVEIEAVRFTKNAVGGINALDILHFCNGKAKFDVHTDTIRIKTLEGTMTARCGDWIVRGVQGEYYPVQDDIFRQTYEPIQ